MTDSIAAPAPLQLTIHPLPDKAPGTFWSNDAPSFKDVLDTINPLQHIPLVSTLYQSFTGDVPSSGANLAGGALLGGPFGFLAALFNEIVKTQTGKDVGGNVLAMIEGNDSSPAATQLANNSLTATYAPPPTNHAAYAAYEHAQSLLA